MDISGISNQTITVSNIFDDQNDEKLKRSHGYDSSAFLTPPPIPLNFTCTIKEKDEEDKEKYTIVTLYPNNSSAVCQGFDKADYLSTSNTTESSLTSSIFSAMV